MQDFLLALPLWNQKNKNKNKTLQTIHKRLAGSSQQLRSQLQRAQTNVITSSFDSFIVCVHRDWLEWLFVLRHSIESRCKNDNRELKQTRTATATKTPSNKRFNVQNKSCARLCTFPCRPLQNNNVKWPSFGYFEEREPQQLVFRIFS